MSCNKYSDEWFLDLYMKYGSVEEAISHHEEYLPISPATFHRKVQKSNLVKSAGKQASLIEVLNFLEKKALSPNSPIEKIYKKMPLRFQTSLVTMHRIYFALKNSIVRREGVALVLTTESNPEKILFGFEEKLLGELTIPMGFCRKEEDSQTSILRILQQEVFANLAVNKKLNFDFDENIKPFMFLDIADVRVKVFKLVIPNELLNQFSSYKLKNHHFLKLNNLLKTNNYRSGVFEILKAYKKLLQLNEAFEVRVIASELNKVLLKAN